MCPPAPDPESQALEELAGGTLRAAPERAWRLFEEAWPQLEARLAIYMRSLRLAQEFREDCGQNTILRVWRAREEYRGHCLDEFYAWVYRITRHEAQRLTDRRGREPLREADTAAEVDIADLQPAGVHDPSLGRAESEEQAAALEACMDGLEERERGLVELLYGEQALTERAVAMMLEISKTYVNILRHAALAALASCLKGKGFQQ